MSSPIEEWLAAFINSPYFSAKLQASIEALEKPEHRVKALMDLMSYVVPAVKGVDPLTSDQKVSDISVTYADAKPPKASKPKAKP